MPINTDLLVTTNSLQQYFVDKDTGLPLASGVVNFYKDNARTVFKNVYYQSGTFNAYEYVALPNPLTLSSVGTMVDDNGNDIEPFYFPYSETDNATFEPYYITVDSAGGERQFTRANFPFNGNSESGSNQVPTLQNIIVNNNFWRNIGSQDLTSSLTATVAPSAHDGFSMPDITFHKDVAGSDDAVTFNTFAPGFTFNPKQLNITPEFYLNHTCTTSGGPETIKYYQIPIVLHIKNLESINASFSIMAQNGGGNVNNTISFGIYQFTGSNDNTPAVPTFLKTFKLDATWTKYSTQFTFPSASGVNTSPAGDDALYLVIGLPANKTCNINFTKPSIYLSDVVPTNDFQTYDVTDSIINSPRTGDFRYTFNSFAPFGWIAANNGSIGLTSPAQTSGTQVWPLYNFLWNNTTRLVCPIGGGASTGTAYGDFNAGLYLSLPNMLGRVPATLNANLPAAQTCTTAGVNLTLASSDGYDTGSPVQFTDGIIPGVAANTVYFVSNVGTPGLLNISATVEDAFNSIWINLGVGAGTISSALGITEGESQHTMIEAELATHAHGWLEDGTSTPITAAVISDQAAVGAGIKVGAGSDNQTVIIADTGSSTPFNVIQPTFYTNVFFKL